MAALRITVRSHLHYYLESVGSAMKESDPTAIVNRIIEDHRAFLQGGTQPAKPSKLPQTETVDAVDAGELSQQIADDFEDFGGIWDGNE